MSAERLLALFDRVADAPDAIPRLRRFVLDLAIRGKLVEQDPGDEPAVELLSAARRNLKAMAVTARRVRWKPTEPFSVGEIDKEVPSGWVAARVNDTALYVNGLAFKPTDWKPAGVPIIRIQNLTDRTREFNYAVGDFPDEVTVRDGDLLVSWSATLEAFKWDRGEGVLNQHIFRVIPDDGLTHRDFLLLLLRSAIREMADSEHAHGLVMTHINRGPFLNHVVLVPPLAEQRRIVARASELMGLLDRLEAARAEREATRDRLTHPGLSMLASSVAGPKVHAASAGFVADAIGSLTARPGQLNALRQGILESAVQGRLVAGNSDDGDATRLVEQIRADRSAVRRPVAPDVGALAHGIPGKWPLLSLDEIIVAGPQNGLSPRESNSDDSPKAITLSATTRGAFDGRFFKRVDVRERDAARYWLDPGDLLFQRGNTRDYVGIAAVYDGPPGEYLFPDLIIRVRVSTRVSIRYVHLWCISPSVRRYFSTKAVGAQASMPKINHGILRATPIGVPPLAEQHRIVAKVDTLMTLCDRLEAALTTADTTRQRLLEALIHEALESDAALEETA